jgi:iron complex outermembrane receptor protein
VQSAESEKDSLDTYQKPSVTVTGNRAVEGISPIPFSNLSGSAIKKIYSGIDVPELLTELPSIISYSENGNNIGYSYLTMRGFSQHRISVFVNGIPQNDPEDHNVYWIDLPDIASFSENIQVQRGAGIVNYGAASIGGSINLTTSNVGLEKSVKIYSGVGLQEFGAGDGSLEAIMNKYSIEVSSGRVGNLSVYAKLSQINSDGYRDNMWAMMNSYYLSATHYHENFTTHINIFGGPISDGLGYYGLPKSYIKDVNLRTKNPSYWEFDSTGENVGYFADRRKHEIENFSQPHFEILNKWFGKGFIFESALFYYQGDGFFDYDGSYWAEDYLKESVSPDYQFADSNMSFVNPMIRGAVSNKHGGWIPRIYIEHPLGSLSIGAEVRFHRSEHYGNIVFSEQLPMGYDPDFKFYSNNGVRNIYSIFVSENLNISEDLTLAFQGQLVNQNYQLQNIKSGSHYLSYLNNDGKTVDSKDKSIFDINYIFFNPRLSMNYKVDEGINIYSMLAYTSREPRMKNLIAAEELYYGAIPQFESDTINGEIAYNFTKPLVKPESMLDFELGTNYRTEHYNLGLNFYWMEYFDELVSTGVLDLWGRPVDGNVPRTRHIGIELQGIAKILKTDFGNLSLSANATLSSNKILEFDYEVFDEEADAIKTISLNENPISGFPDVLITGRLNYDFKGFFASLSARYVGEFRTDNYGDMLSNPDLQVYLTDYKDNIVEPYFLLNLDLGYSFEDVLIFKSLKIHGKINNITNELYAAYGTGRTFFPGAERNYYLGFEIGL